MRDRDPDRVRDTERTTIIHTDGGGGGGGLLLAVVVLILLAALLFFLFGGGLGRDSDEGDVNVNIDAPAVPETQIPAIELPDVNVNVPDNQRGDGDTTNRSE